MTHDKAQEAAQKLQENVQSVRETVSSAKQSYQDAVSSGVQNTTGGDEIVMQLADTVISSGILEKIGAEYGATGAAVVAVVVGLYWTWRKKSGEIQNEIQQQGEEEEKEERKILSSEESTEEENKKEEEQVEKPQKEEEGAKSLDEKAEEPKSAS